METPSDADQPGGQRRLSANVKLLGLVSLINDIAGELAFPLLPLFVQNVLGGTKLQLGAIEGVADTTASFVKLLSGNLSDRLRRRRGFVVAGYALAAVARPLIGLATAPWQVFVVRTTDRLGKGIRSAPRDALIADSTPAQMRGLAYGFNQAMDHVGAAVGPLLALAFLHYWPDRLRLLFLLTLFPGLLVVGLLALGLKERPIHTTAAKPLPLKLASLDRRFRLFLLVLVVFALGNSSDIFVLARAEELGMSGPALWCGFHLVKSAGNLAAGSAVDRLGPRPLILSGWLVYAAIYFAFAWADSAWEIWALFLGYALFYALTEPAEKALVANLVSSDERGLAFGWYNFALGIVALPANLIFGAIYDSYGPQAAFGWGAACALVAALGLAIIIDKGNGERTL
jgi:MFS family permease